MQYSAIIGFIGQRLGYYIADSKNLDVLLPDTGDRYSSTPLFAE